MGHSSRFGGFFGDNKSRSVGWGDWRARSPTCCIFGPTMVPPDESCFYDSAVSGGTGIYSYVWRRNGVQIGTGSGVNVWTGDLSRYTLRLNVSDTGGADGFDQLSATVSSQAPPCFN